MTSPPVVVSPDETLDAAVALMEQRGLHHLLVVDRDRLVGILSSADLLKLALLRRPDDELGPAAPARSLDLRARDVAQTRVAVLRENASLKEAARALSLGGFHALPVLAIDGTPVGIVTSSDLVGLLIDQIERDGSPGVSRDPPSGESRDGLPSHLLEVLRSAEIYLHSGQSEQQHARLTRAVARARELMAVKGAMQVGPD